MFNNVGPSERRQTARKRIATGVYISWQGRPHRYQTRNISVNGVFLEASRDNPPLGARVDLVFVVHKGTVVRIHRLPAVVARISRNGAALIWNRHRNRSVSGRLPH